MKPVCLKSKSLKATDKKEKNMPTLECKIFSRCTGYEKKFQNSLKCHIQEQVSRKATHKF